MSHFKIRRCVAPGKEWDGDYAILDGQHIIAETFRQVGENEFSDSFYHARLFAASPILVDLAADLARAYERIAEISISMDESSDVLKRRDTILGLLSELKHAQPT